MMANEWNQKYPIGTKVRYFPIREGQEFKDTKTRSEAWELGHGALVVMIEGKSGGVSLDHLIILNDD